MTYPLALFLLQLLIVVVACQILGSLFQRIGQPRVMGEMIAGIVLGPSVIGALWPQFSTAIFPKESLGHLQLLSQVGLVLFMFVIGMELDVQVLKNRARTASIIAIGSITLPFALGVGAAYFLYNRFSTSGTQFYQFALFMGIAMSITAFPVLARIIRERNMTGTYLGSMGLVCAAIDDVVGWCLLALVVALVKGGADNSTLQIIGYSIAYVAVMLVVVKPLLKKICNEQWMGRNPTMGLLFVVMLLSAWVCEMIGIHALFGAFLAGVIMPSLLELRERMINNIEHVALVLLLPLFFVFTGLRTEVGLLNDWTGVGICLGIIAIAVIGKIGGVTIAGRIAGETPRNSLAIGILMNTRGLMELVVLNIGYELGILSPEIFTMMVLMAIITTLMTGPLLNRITIPTHHDQDREG